MSGGGQTTQTTKNSLPAWAVPYAQGLLGMGSQLFTPGGHPGQMPANMQQQVAGFTPDQVSAMNKIQQRAGVTPNIAPGTTPGSSISQVNPVQGVATSTNPPPPVQTPDGGVSNPPVAAAPPPAAQPPPPTPGPSPKPKKKKKK
jgi:hypothetical protein